MVVRICHANLLALVNIRSSPQQVDKSPEHFGRLFPVFPVISKPGHNSGLIVVAPENGIPAAMLLHPLLPGLKQLLKRLQVWLFQFPFISIPVIHLQVVEVKAHGKLMLRWVRVADAVFQSGGRHLSHCHHAVNAGIPHQLLQILVNSRPICVKAAAVSLLVVLKAVRF